MNKRIQALVEQAKQHALTTAPDCTRHPIDAYMEKFAELIVRECASICELNGQSYTHSFTPAKARLAESTSNHCATMIKKHFGVEE
jgi:hypothetical protein